MSSSSVRRCPIGMMFSISSGSASTFVVVGVGERGVAAHLRPRDAQHVRMRARLARARRGRGRRLGAAGEAEPMHLADHRVARDAAELGSDLAGREAIGPQFLQQSRRVRQSSSSQIPRHSPRREAPDRIRRSLGSNWLARRVLPTTDVFRNCPPHEMSYLTIKTLQYGGSSDARVAPVASTCSVLVCITVHIFRAALDDDAIRTMSV